MVEYVKTKKGYFYKLSKNGEKKRISQEEFSKKQKKTIKNKNMIGGYGGPPIEPSDILYQDDLVCILRPDVKKGIIVFTNYRQPPGIPSLCELGLKTGQQLRAEGVDFGRTVTHPYSFFRAPFYAAPFIDYSTLETELISSFGRMDYRSKIFIRVDPDRTYVFSSEIRARISKDDPRYDSFLFSSKKTLSDYLRIIHNNTLIEQRPPPGFQTYWHLFSSNVELRPIMMYSSNGMQEGGAQMNGGGPPAFPLDSHPINFNSEILVQIPNLTPNFFVACT